MTGIRKFEVDINGQKVKCCGFAGNDSNTTNNKMELNAIMCSIKLIYTQFSIPVDAVIHTDSKYCINSLTEWYKKWKQNNWMKRGFDGSLEAVKNKQYIKPCIDMLEDMGAHNVEFKWIKGHSGNLYNEAADQIAVFKRLQIK